MKMRFDVVLKRSLVFCAGAISLLASAVSAQESYPIGPGDVLRVSFLSNPDFDRSLTVDIDGTVFIPLIGEVNVQGQPINALREQIPILMTGAVFRERLGGEYLLVSLEPEDVVIDVEAYRPVYVDGSVNSPGRQPFVVGMTARQAIAAAEGLMDDGAAGNDIGASRNHPRVLMAELVGVLAELAVHQAILDGTDTIDTSELEGLSAPSDLIDRAIELAQSQVATSTEILNEELEFLDTSISEAEARIMASLRREETMTAVVSAEEAEVERVEERVARRIVSSEVLTQARRAYLQAVDRLGGVQASRLRAEADRRELVLERAQTVRERSLELQARLQELSQQASQLRVRIELSSTGPATIELDQTASRAPRITIFRRTGGQAQEIEASPGALLLPGDVVNVGFGT